MATFGERLKQERKSRGIRLKDIAEATKIAQHHLDALERNDLASLPGGTFNKGYVRAYARFIGLDADAVVESYLLEEQTQGITAPSGEKIAEDLSRVVKEQDERRREGGGGFDRRRMLLLGLVAVVVAFIGWLVLRPAPTVEPPPDTRQTLPVEASSTPAMPEPIVAEPDGSAEMPAAVEPPASTEGMAEESADAPADAASLELEEPAPIPVTADPESPAAPEERPAAESMPAVEPPAAAEPDVVASAEPEAPVAASSLSVASSGVGTGVVDRQLVGEGDRFEAGSQVFFWTRVVGGQSGDVLDHVWINEGKVVESLALNIGASHWRTYSRKKIFATGAWVVEARDAGGATLARHEFECVAGGSPPSTP